MSCMARIRRQPPGALPIAVLALVVAVGGGSYAIAGGARRRHAVAKIARRIANRQISRRASHLSVRKAVTAKTATTAGTASFAGKATAANHAASADSATTASHADSATTANSAFSTFHDGPLVLPNSSVLATIATLDIPKSGDYVMFAKFEARNESASIYSVSECKLVAGSAFDRTRFTLDTEGKPAQLEDASLQLTAAFPTPGNVQLQCKNNGGVVILESTKVTAIQVAQLTSTGF